MRRNPTFDILKGFAAIMMIVANAAPVFSGDMPMMIRICFSMAAPIFVMMSGFMVNYIIDRHPLHYFFIKGLFIFMLGAFIDVFINHLKPFESYDVLYLIGSTLPIAALAARFLSERLIIVAIILINGIGVWLRSSFGYAAPIIMTDLHMPTMDILPTVIPLRHWFFDGWFPLFPWMSFPLIGVLLSKLYKKSHNPLYFENKNVLLTSFAVFLAGLVLWIIEPSPMLVRGGYFEVFYPTTIGIAAIFIGFALVMLAYAEFITPNYWAQKLLATLGKGILGVYTLHLTIINYVIKPIFGTITDVKIYLGVGAIHVGVIIIFMLCINAFKEKHKNLPTLFYWFFGK